MPSQLVLYFGVGSVAILAFSAYLYFFKPVRGHPTKRILNSSIDKKPRWVYAGDGAGSFYDSKVKNITVAGDYSDVELMNGIKLYKVSMKDHVVIPKSWNLAAGDEYVILCRVDATNRVYPWSRFALTEYDEMSKITKKRMEDELIDELLKKKDLFSDSKKIYTSTPQNYDVSQLIK